MASLEVTRAPPITFSTVRCHISTATLFNLCRMCTPMALRSWPPGRLPERVSITATLIGSSESPEAVRLVPGPLRANPRGYPRRLWAPPRRHCPAPLGVRSPILPYWLHFHTNTKSKRPRGVLPLTPRKRERPRSSCLAAVIVAVAPVAATRAGPA